MEAQVLNAFTEIYFINKDQEDVPAESLSKINVIGVYFTSSWCPPCIQFRENLLKFYEEVNAKEKVFEIIQVSNEKNEKDFDNFLNEPWLYVQFNDPFMYELVEEYKIEQLPSLLIVNKERTILSEKGRKDIIDLGDKAFEKWYKRYRDLKDEGLIEN